MSTPTTVQSNLVPIAYSTDDVTYKNLVCKKAWNWNGDTPVNQEESDCGIHIGLGANAWSFDVELLLNTTPNGSTEVVFKDLLTDWSAQALRYVKVLYPAVTGTSFYIQGSVYITKFTINNQVGNLVNATLTFTGASSVDIIP